MHRSIRHATFLAAVALLSAGCGNKNQAEMPVPETEGSTTTTTTYTPHTPVSGGKISENLLDAARRATLEDRILFGFDQSELTPTARQSLTEKAEVLRAIPSLTLRIEGHADERGSDEYNLALSNRRAAAAKRFLVNLGISGDRLETFGYGEEQPLDPSETEAAWTQNRRDEFRVSSGRLAQQ